MFIWEVITEIQGNMSKSYIRDRMGGFNNSSVKQSIKEKLCSTMTPMWESPVVCH